ncbi:hypothetical protein AVEN_146215-1 [Araneus ventricosus]|uniref:Ig-like domain-containing protein n=1 Tax=Araneus ventricosus TaxID=182803 RepID=A0A4Y2CJK0_ARAVE|nr:hypothetical protein AVEN_146215-1 [Araneus ventricosus]
MNKPLQRKLSKSGSQTVYLRHVDLNSGGTYRCEVSAEAPEFQTVAAEKKMDVFVLPTEGPKITGGLSKYRVGDTVYVNCTSSKSKPAATLRWYINDELEGILSGRQAETSAPTFQRGTPISSHYSCQDLAISANGNLSLDFGACILEFR